MKHPMMHSRRVRYGGMTVSLTVTLIAALVLLNIIFSTLASRFSWYIDMTPDKLYSVSDLCRELIRDSVDAAEAKDGQPVKAEIIFCEDYRSYEQGSTGSYIYNTAHELALAFPDVFEIRWFDCWLDKSYAEELGVTSASNVVLRLQNGQSRVFSQQEFYTFEDGNTTTPVGYDGERVFATALSSLLRTDRPLACFTVNHDETFFDNTLVFLLRDAGYDISLLDLYYHEIPEECELLVIYNPNADAIVADGISDRSELDKINAFLDQGKNMMVYLSANTPVLENFDRFLSSWGVTVGRDEDEATGRSYNCMVKDTSSALTADGFTILADYATAGKGADITQPLTSSDFVPKVVFRDATALLVADGYIGAGASTYTSGTRTRHDLFYASSNAVAFANSKQLSHIDGALPLMTLTVDDATGARVLVCASTEYAAEDYLQSAVFGNSDALLCTVQDMGMKTTLVGLHYKPFASLTIESITTAQMLHWTLALTIIPAVLVLGVAIVILVRRKYS